MKDDTNAETEHLPMQKKSKSTAVAAPEERYLALKGDADQVADILRINLGDMELKWSDLNRIKVPGGDSKFWIIHGPDGESTAKKLEGIILAHRRMRAYWEDPEPTGKPPVCKSDGSKNGVGVRWEGDDPTEYHACKPCKWNVFGSDHRGGKGKACKEMMVLFLLREQSMLPDVLILPPTSINLYSKYITLISGRGQYYHQVITAFELQSAKNDAGQTYNIVHETSVTTLSSESMARLKTFADMFAKDLQSVEVKPESYWEGSEAASD